MGKLRLAMVAGELSGDTLGAGLLTALAQRGIEVEAFGVGGPAMQRAGLEVWFDAREISVMGLAEVVRHLPRLLRLKRQLKTRIIARQPHAFVGIDLPDFNLALASNLRESTVTTVQYVSPSVWAWRPKRVRKIAKAIDLVLCLLPFEPAFYAKHQVLAAFVGHPLVDAIATQPEVITARQELALPLDKPTIALLPGSRVAEVASLSGIFLRTATLIQKQLPEVRFVTALASAETRAVWHAAAGAHRDAPDVTVCEAPACTVIGAADTVLLASGTVALEALLVGRPMVVSYRVSAFTHWLMKTFKLLKVRHFSLPNLLAERALVPELVQDDAVPEKLAAAVIGQYARRADPGLHDAYAQVRQALSGNANHAAADALLQLLRQKQVFMDA